MKKLGLLLFFLLVFAIPAYAGHEDDPRTRNLHPMGHIVEPASLLNADVGNPDVHTDIAFWGDYAFQGSWLGFNIRDISAPGNPRQVSYTSCLGNQGDMVVWDNILVRSWNTPAGTPGLFGAGLSCDGQDVAEGFEGLHIFDVSDPTDPVAIGRMSEQGWTEQIFISAGFAYIVERLKSIPEGEGTLLDNSMIVYGGAIGDGNR